MSFHPNSYQSIKHDVYALIIFYWIGCALGIFGAKSFVTAWKNIGLAFAVGVPIYFFVFYSNSTKPVYNSAGVRVGQVEAPVEHQNQHGDV